MSGGAEVVVLDVNETLSDLRPLDARFTDLGLPPGTSATWFAAVLRDGFAVAVHGEAAAFADVGRDVLAGLLVRHEVEAGSAEDAFEHVLEGFLGLPLHPDVVPGLRALREAGFRVVTLSNGSAAVAQRLLADHGAADLVEQVLTVEDAGVWKPAPGAYRYAAERCGVDAAATCLVAVHPWDCDGAARAGLSTAFVDRLGSPWPGHFRPPDLTVPALTDLAERLTP